MEVESMDDNNNPNIDNETIDWFGICTDPEVDITKKCVFCKDSNRNPLEAPDSATNSYFTTDCRHRVCGFCAKTKQPGQVLCQLCGSRILRYVKDPPEYLALKALNEVRKEVYTQWNLSREDFVREADYNAFLEEREQLISAILVAKSSEKSIRSKLEQDIQTKRKAFVEEHRDAIHKNNARINEHRDQVEREIAAYKRMVEELRARVKREKLEEEEERLRKEQAQNDERLGTVRSNLAETIKTGQNAKSSLEDQKTYLYAKNDPLTSNGPPPTLISNKPKVASATTVEPELIFKAGGLEIGIVSRRTLSEMRAGWDLLM
jgi:hypothetical protein